jgi:hypothetical protein
MKFDSLPLLNLRLRSGLEAADSGILIWRAKLPALLLFFAVPALFVFCAACIIPSPFESAGQDLSDAIMVRGVTGFVLLWWFKPLFDRFALQVISKVYFNKKVRAKELFAGLAPNIFRALLADITWRRFSPSRGASIVIRVLERIKRKQYKARRGVLERGGINFVVYITIICVVLEIIFIIAAIVFLYLIFMMLDIDFVPGLLIAWYTIWFIDYCLLETLYVAMSFALYINARSITEGWDLEIIFASLAKNREAHIEI